MAARFRGVGASGPRCGVGGRLRTALVRALLLGIAIAPFAGVVGAGGAVTATAPIPDEVMYTLSVRFVGTEDSGQARRVTSYVARSVRAFPLTRTPSSAGPVFRFEAKVAGTLGHTGSGYNYFGGGGECTEAATRRVTGRVAVVPLVGRRQNPAPLHIDIDPKPPTAVETCYSSEGTRSQWPVHSLLPQAPRWNGMLLFVETKPVDLSKSYGRAFTVEYRTSHVATHNGHLRRYTWTLTFTPVRPPAERTRWQVDVQGRDLWSWGWAAAGPGARVHVDWLHRTVLEIEDGKVVSATGKVSVLGVGSVSDPAGVFRVEQKATERPGPGYRLRWARKRGSTLELNLLHDPGETYVLDFSLRLTGPEALERMRAAGVPNPEHRYADFVKRGPIVLREVGHVPGSSRLVVTLRPGSQYRTPEGFNEQLPCRIFGTDDKDCFLTRGGENVTVTKLG